MSLTNEEIKAILEAAERKSDKWISHFHGSAWWGDHNLSDLAETLALRERVAELERELEWMQIKYNTEMRIRQAYQSGSEEVARKAYRQGFMDSGEGFNGELYQDGFSKVVSVYNQMEAEYIENIKEQAK